MIEPCDRKGRPRRFKNGHARRRPALDRFMEKVDQTETCWIWTGAKTPEGYPVFWSGDGHNVYAYRWAWEHFVAPIPAGYEIDHVCRNSLCVRPHPEHLEPVTGDENNRRRDEALNWGSYR